MSGMPFGNNGGGVLGKLIGGPGVPEQSGKKEKIPAYISSEDLDRLRNTVVALQRNSEVAEPPVSLSAFVAAAVMLAVEEAEETYNNGRPFPARPNAKLKTGPPIQS
ncbi:hypothetical protein ACFV84_36090 [Kitasatospora sp. NPDC059811]|uniref:hypothetical protein n=1 Tax=Streptomycetaceae TaxID=2062 RepID=UPI0007AFDDCA|nr:hypothetical protein [Streptomyces sp. MJM8645]